MLSDIINSMDGEVIEIPCAAIDDNGTEYSGEISIAFLDSTFQINSISTPIAEEEFQSLLIKANEFGIYGEPWRRTFTKWRNGGVI